MQDYDAKGLTIKAWSVSIVGVIAGSSAFTQSPEVLLFAAIVSIMFWLIEGSWKSFQRSNYDRIDAIESFMRTDGQKGTIHCLQISKSWVIEYTRKCSKFEYMKNMLLSFHVFLPHAAFGILLLAGYIALKFGW